MGKPKYHRDEEEDAVSRERAVMGTGMVMIMVAIAALVLGAIALAQSMSTASSAEKVELWGQNLTFTGLGTGAFNVPATIVKQNFFHTLRIFAANSTCTANSSVATANAATILVNRLPLVEQSEPAMVYSGGARINGYVTLTTAGVITIGGYGQDLKIGVCGWSNDIVLNYVISAT